MSNLYLIIGSSIWIGMWVALGIVAVAACIVGGRAERGLRR